jgi:hypothetical protein
MGRCGTAGVGARTGGSVCPLAIQHSASKDKEMTILFITTIFNSTIQRFNGIQQRFIHG